MERIPLTPAINFEFAPNQWRLVQDGYPPIVLVDGDAQSFRFDETFATQQGVAMSSLPTSFVSDVRLVLNPHGMVWALMLKLNSPITPQLLLHTWSTDDVQAESLGKTVGEQIAMIIQKPFVFIGQDGQPHTSGYTVSSQVAPEPEIDPIPLRALPILMDDWVLRRVGEGAALQPTGEWKRRAFVRSGFYLFGALAFVALGIGSIQSGLADVNPTWLPYAACALALFLVYLSLETLWQVVNRRQIVVDEQHQEIRCQRAIMDIVDWRVPFEQVDYLLVSQDVSRSQGRRRSTDPMLIAQDVWVHLYAHDEFYLIGEMEDAMGKSWVWETIRQRDVGDPRRELDLRDYDTPLHHATLHLAKLLGTTAYLDIR